MAFKTAPSKFHRNQVFTVVKGNTVYAQLSQLNLATPRYCLITSQ